MSYVNQGQFQERRPGTQQIKVTSTKEAEQIANEAIYKANQQIAEIKTLANQQTADFETWANHCELQARIAWEENQRLRAMVAELEARVAALEAEAARLGKKAGRRSGKNKGVEWEGLEGNG